MKDRARAIVIGGGAGGASIAYWLTRLGWNDVVLCERAELTSGSTFHSAGLVGQLRGSLGLTRMMMRSVDLYRKLESGNQVSVGLFHDALRQLHDDHQLYLHPWTGPLYALPEPAFALLVGHEVAYYASQRRSQESGVRSQERASGVLTPDS